jgi:hypothetical protein
MIYLQILMGAFIVSVLLLIAMFFKNRTLKKEIKVLEEVIVLKDTTISNFEASRVAVKDVIENLSSHDEVMQLVEAGESRAEISDKLGIPVNKIELIIKFDKIKKEKHL